MNSIKISVVLSRPHITRFLAFDVFRYPHDTDIVTVLCGVRHSATARGSIPGGNCVKTELHFLHKGQLMGVLSLNDLTVDGM